MAKLSHPNIIAVYDFGTTSEGHLYFVMEFIEGANLHAIIRAQELSADQALWLAGQVCAAVAYAHGKGVVHRDIKPANVMVDTEGNAKVADFGLARLTDAGAEQLGHTQTGTVMGTPDYMAPEQMRGMNVDHRADIYSLGVMLYEMVAGHRPFEGVTRAEIIRLLRRAGFAILECMALGFTADGGLSWPAWLPGLRAHGFLIAAEKPR